MIPRFLFLVVLAAPIFAADIPRPEHPRPDFRRDAWLNLNGTWQFEFDPGDVGLAENWAASKTEWSRSLVVPFPWEAPLSGIGRDEADVGWYRRTFNVPEEWEGRRVFLRFGAVDWKATVWINGRLAGEHNGGYTPFEFEITGLLTSGEQTVVVRAEDKTLRDQPTGKQINWYTTTSGIWQTVWLEARGQAYIDNIRFIADAGAGQVEARARILAATDARATLVFERDVDEAESAALPAQSFQVDLPAGTSEHRLVLNVPDARFWSPETPHLYFVRALLRLGIRNADVVHTYFGIRTVGTGKFAGQDFKYVTLNGLPVYLRGALDQAFHPGGVYTYPSDDVIRGDLSAAKRFGLNFLRLHIKIDEPRFYYWADRLGVLLMCDMPCFWEWSEDATSRWEAMLRDAVERDFNHPSIFSWCLFNESWGLGGNDYKRRPERQKWVEEMYHLAKRLDPTRLVEDNSPCFYDHVGTDINSWHFYINGYEEARRHIAHVVEMTSPESGFNCVPGKTQGDVPLINSEYGGVSAGAGDADISWCFKYLTNELRRHARIGGYVYTELQDIEWEHNGYLNYDRTEKEFGYGDMFPGMTPADLNGPDFLVMDCPPYMKVHPGATVEIPLYFSHFSGRQLLAPRVRWQLRACGTVFSYLPLNNINWSIKADPWTVVQAGTIRLSDVTPDLYAVCAWVEDGSDVIARNYVNLMVEEPEPRVSVDESRRVKLTWDPGEVYDSSWGDLLLFAARMPEKVWGTGGGWIEYRLKLPPGLSKTLMVKEPELIEPGGILSVELAAKAGWERVDWDRRRPYDYPQTDARKWPTRFNLFVNGDMVYSGTLEDDPADARGVLSHAREFHPGSYGYATAISIPVDALCKGASDEIALRFEVPADASPCGGLAVFGDGMGRYAFDPTLSFVVSSTLEARTSGESAAVIGRRAKVVLPTAEEKAIDWRYTESEPDADWMQPNYDDSRWKRGPAGFGEPGTPGGILGTEWTSHHIWLRNTFVLDGTPEAALLRYHHDDELEVYINGKEIFRRGRWSTFYADWKLPPEALSALQPGENTIAVHCHEDAGGQFIDVGLTVLGPSPISAGL